MKDLESLRESYSEEFRFRLPNGKLLDRDEVLEVVRNGSVEINDVKMIDIDLRPFGDFAVVSATVELDAVLDGETFNGRFAGGGSFVRRQGKWKIADEYLGIPIEDAEAGEKGPGK